MGVINNKNATLSGLNFKNLSLYYNHNIPSGLKTLQHWHYVFCQNTLPLLLKHSFNIYYRKSRRDETIITITN